ncbi:hypothetical protein R6Q59_011255 [Mikania micrantha]
MSSSSLTSSPARSSISTTAIVGSNVVPSSLAVDEIHFASDFNTFQDCKDDAIRGGNRKEKKGKEMRGKERKRMAFFPSISFQIVRKEKQGNLA